MPIENDTPESPLRLMLRRRGLHVSERSSAEKPLLPAAPFVDRYYRLLHRYSFRIFLRDVIKRYPRFTSEAVAQYADEHAIASYLRFLGEAGLIREDGWQFVMTVDPGSSFGPTLEWYVSQLLRRELGAATLSGVRFKHSAMSGDYDVLAGFDGLLLYVETKSSPPGQIEEPEVRGFLERLDQLAPDVAVFFDDTRLRMLDKVVPLFGTALARLDVSLPPPSRIDAERFRVGHRLFIMNAHPSVLSNVLEALRIYHRRRNPLLPRSADVRTKEGET